MLKLNYSGSLESKEIIDKEVWSKHATENTDDKKDFLEHKIRKLSTSRKFIEKVNQYEKIFHSSNSIIELGGVAAGHLILLKNFFLIPL